MNPEQHIFESSYNQGRPFVRAKIGIVNLENSRQTTIETVFWIDTGFDGGIHVARTFESDAKGVGVSLLDGSIGMAGGRTETAHRCFAYLQQIGDFELPAPGLEAEIIFHGMDRHGLIGLDILKNWTIKFDGLNQFFKISRLSS
jgi:hypothetical protein